MKRVITLGLLVGVLFSFLTACSGDGLLPNGGLSPTDGPSAPDGSSDLGDIVVDVSYYQSEEDLFTARDCRTTFEESQCTLLQLNGSSATVSGEGATVDDTCITISQEGSYLVRGSLDQGQILVKAPDSAKVHLIFDGVTIFSLSSSALGILSADKVFVTLLGSNSLANGGSFDGLIDEKIDGTLYSKQDLTLNGSGSLLLQAPAGHGVVCKDDLVITGGSYQIAAASHGLDANDSIRIKNATLTIQAGKDGLHAENSEDATLGFVYLSSGTLNLTTEGDGISAGSFLQVAGGDVTVLAGGGYENGDKVSSNDYGNYPGGFPGGPGGGRPGGGSIRSTIESDDAGMSMKGLKANSGILLSNGNFQIDSADDALHTNGTMQVCGGVYTIASGDDALHADTSLQVSGGRVTISTCYEGLEAQHILVSDGTISLIARDDGLNAAGGVDGSGTGGRDEYPNYGGGPGGRPGGISGNSSGTVVISGGILSVQASGDGIDANGTLEISGGYTTVVGPTQGDTATLDYDVSARISGGVFIGTGAYTNMAQTFSSANQGVIAVRVGNQAAETKIVVATKDGEELLSFTPPLSYQLMILSSPELVSGQSYVVSVGAMSETLQVS